MEFLGPFHPQLVHFPIALILVSLLFELVGRLTDAAWWRKAAFAMLIVGVMGAGAAVLSGDQAGEKAEHAGVPEAAVDAHEDAAKIAWFLGLGAVVARAIAGRTGAARGAVAGLALLLHVLAASSVGVAGYRGGKLVYEHGAGVKPGITTGAAAGPSEHEPGEHEANEH